MPRDLLGRPLEETPAPPLEKGRCPVCASPRPERALLPLRDTIWGRAGEFALVDCAPCGHRWLSPRPVPEHMSFYYRELWGDPRAERLQWGPIARGLNRLRLRALLREMPLTPDDHHLEVGFGLGAFLLLVARRTGAKVTGIDMDPMAVEFVARRAKVLGIRVDLRTGALESPSSKDLPTLASAGLMHVVEHLYEPVRELARVREHLRPGGCVLVEVPSAHAFGARVFGRWWVGQVAPQHLSLFSRASLERALTDAGYRDVRVRDAFIPGLLVLSAVIWWHWNLGGGSRHERNPLFLLLALVMALTAGPLLLLLDLLAAPLFALAGYGEVLRATARA